LKRDLPVVVSENHKHCLSEQFNNVTVTDSEKVPPRKIRRRNILIAITAEPKMRAARFWTRCKFMKNKE
jgi:hypothetical protein